MDKDFYVAFERRHRGPRDLIKSRLRVYLPFVEPLKRFYEHPTAVDLGCGRGEWLEVLSEVGVDVQGVDIDGGMLDEFRHAGLDVLKGDAVAFLRNVPEASHIVVSGFHLAEHVSFPDLQTLVQEAFRVLRPGGLLILETPNPENIVVGTSGFYLDPTHQRPIPPELLSFVPEYYGFARVKVLRLQEPPVLARGGAPELLDVLKGVSPDYAVIAQKLGDADLLAATDALFQDEYGLTLEALARRYDQYKDDRTGAAEERIGAAEERIAATEARLAGAEGRAVEAQARAVAAEERAGEAHACAVEAQAWGRGAEARLAEVLASTSWRVTVPLRWVGIHVKRPLGLMGAAPVRLRSAARRALVHASLFVRARPRLRRASRAVIDRFPALKARLIRAATGWPITAEGREAGPWHSSGDGQQLTPRARRFYAKLKAGAQTGREGR